jgi:hypothetical protein
LVFQYQGPS